MTWSLWFTFFPDRLGKVLQSRAHIWIKVGCVNLFVFVVLAEIGFRLVNPVLARHGLFGSEVTPANLKPHHPVTGSIGQSNSYGFKDRERQFDKPCCGPRIVALGDSVLWGIRVSYDESLSTLLE